MANFIGLVYATLKNEGIDTKDMSTDEAVKKYNELQKKAGGKAGEKEGTPAEQRKLEQKGIVDKGKRAGEYKFYETSKVVSQADKLSDSDREIVDDAIYWAKKNGEASVKSVFEQLQSDMAGFLSYGKNGNYEAVRDYIREQVFTDKEKSETFTDDSENWESGKYTGDEARFNKIHNAFSRGKVGERATKEMLSELGINEAGIKNFMITNELFNTQQNPDTVVKIARRIFNDGEYRK